MSEIIPSRNIGLDLIRVTEATALAAGRWIGSGNRQAAHQAASQAMYELLQAINIKGHIVIGEETRMGSSSPLDSGQQVGTGDGPPADVIVDPIDGTNLLIKGSPGAVSIVAVAPRGTMWAPDRAATYMDKIVVDRDVASALVAECIDAPAAWTLALVARVKEKAVRDLTVAVLDRPRHADLIDEIRASGARILLRQEGDAEAALEAALPGTGVDVMLGIGGVSEGVIAACAVKAIGGAMLGRLAPQSREEYDALTAAGADLTRILTEDDMVSGDDIFFAATGITGSAVLGPVTYDGNRVTTNSLLIRAATRTRRFIQAEHLIDVVREEGVGALQE